MKTLGIDFGKKKVGLAIAETFLSEPYKVVRFTKQTELLAKLMAIIKTERVEKIVFGSPGGVVGKEVTEFAKLLSEKIKGIEITFFDESYSTRQAQALSIEAGIKRGKRSRLEDAFAASVMLQEYLDTSS